MNCDLGIHVCLDWTSVSGLTLNSSRVDELLQELLASETPSRGISNTGSLFCCWSVAASPENKHSLTDQSKI